MQRRNHQFLSQFTVISPVAGVFLLSPMFVSGKILVAIIAPSFHFVVILVKTGLQSKHCFPSPDFPKSRSLTFPIHMHNHLLQIWYGSIQEDFLIKTCRRINLALQYIHAILSLSISLPKRFVAGRSHVFFFSRHTREAVTSHANTNRIKRTCQLSYYGVIDCTVLCTR